MYVVSCERFPLWYDNNAELTDELELSHDV